MIVLLTLSLEFQTLHNVFSYFVVLFPVTAPPLFVVVDQSILKTPGFTTGHFHCMFSLFENNAFATFTVWLFHSNAFDEKPSVVKELML